VKALQKMAGQNASPGLSNTVLHKARINLFWILCDLQHTTVNYFGNRRGGTD
jgi:hypothetical protein